MWDTRYGELAALRLAEDRAAAEQVTALAVSAGPGLWPWLRRAVGARLVAWGERLLAPAPATR
ncbi:MAG TPA: hypothetical protein VFH54_01145 [Mycobacteriales bacterium]|nr:hypothetical protein [Mycobacteriales bacterium]